MVEKIQLEFPNTKGKHNTNLQASVDRLLNANSYRDLSTVCIIPTKGNIHARVVQNWMTHINQMNQKYIRIPTMCSNKYDGFNNVLFSILGIGGLREFKYVLTLEEDIMPPWDGLLKLYESIEKYDVVGGLIWENRPGGVPMVYGNPHYMPQTFSPIPLATETVQECLALSTGFTLFKMKIFLDERVQKPWFVTNNNITRPDIYFFENIHKLGYTVACDTRVKVGHYDYENDIVW